MEKPSHAFRYLQAVRQEGSSWAGLVADASQTHLNPPGPGLGVVPAVQAQPMQSSQNSSQDQLLLCCSYPSFQNSKRKSKTLHLPPPPSPQSSWTGRGQAATALLLWFNPALRVKKKSQEMASWPVLIRSKFCILENEQQLCPSHFSNHSRVIKIMIKWETRIFTQHIHLPPSGEQGTTSGVFVYFCHLYTL